METGHLFPLEHFAEGPPPVRPRDEIPGGSLGFTFCPKGSPIGHTPNFAMMGCPPPSNGQGHRRRCGHLRGGDDLIHPKTGKSSQSPPVNEPKSNVPHEGRPPREGVRVLFPPQTLVNRIQIQDLLNNRPRPFCQPNQAHEMNDVSVSSLSFRSRSIPEGICHQGSPWGSPRRTRR